MCKKAKQDILVCALIYLFIMFCFWQTLTMKSGSAVMPHMVLAVATACNTALLVRSVSQLHKNSFSEGYTSVDEIKVPVLMFLGVVLYCLLFNFLNYFIATAIMLLVFMLVEKVKPLWLVLTIDVVYLAFIYLLFIVVLKVPLIR
ncbi:MAG TPA: tripartite tricarboxylate transporter TctB family protein [Clostridia bacterium]|nr:tripartite tricarboxylate transporter TctB family protein [Clostridia bacterium]